MSEISVVQFERQTLPSETYLSELGDDGPPYTVHGVALGDDDVTKGASGIKKKWPAEELQKGADTLKGKKLVIDHDNSALGVVGEVTKAGYKEGTGVIYEAELMEEDLAEKIEKGLLEVSIRGYHNEVSNLEEDEETGAKVVEDIVFENLSIVPSGASPSNTLEMGEHAELSAAELAEFTASLDEAELQDEIEPGMWVTTGDTYGITVSPVEDGEVEVDIYEEVDGKWRAIGETEMFDADSLDEWDVDEEDIGEMKDDGGDEDGENDEEENSAIQRGQFVKWKDIDNTWRHGQIIDVDQDGSQMVATMRRFTEGGDALDETEQKPVQGLDMWDESPDPDSSEKSVSAESDASSDDYGATVGDVIRLLNSFVEENATTTKDVPTKDAQPEHDPIGADDEPVTIGDMTVRELIEQLNADELSSNRRVEGEEEILDGSSSINEMKENSPERFTPDDVEEASADEGKSVDNMTQEESDVEELQDYEMHEVSWDGTTESDWSSPDMEDFDTDDLGEIDSHFIISASGFPPENFGDLKLPVVEPNGDLNVNALAAVKGGRGVSAVEGLSSDMEDEIVNYVNGLANEHFDKDWGKDEEENMEHGDVPDNHKFESKEDAEDKAEDLGLEGAHKMGDMWVPGESHEDYVAAVSEASGHGDEEEEMQEHDIEGTSGRPTPQTQVRPGGVRVLSNDDLQSYGASKMDSLTTYKVINMNDEIEEKLSELDEPVAVEAAELQELQDKADQFEDISENLSELRERTDLLDKVEREQVEELADSDDPVVVESEELAELEDEAEQVKSVYAASLAEEMPAFTAEELSDKFSIEELREKHEEIVGDMEEELSSENAEPRSTDPSEEELEEEQPDKEEEELADEVAQKQAEIRSKILGGE